MPGMSHDGNGQGEMDHEQGKVPPGKAPAEEPMAVHGPDTHGPGNAAVAMMPKSRLNEPGDGLENTGTRVLTYADLRARDPAYDLRKPSREIELHLTGNMDRYIWGFDGKKYSESSPLGFRYGERLRVILVNDTMMEHPIHLHGMWMELENGNGEYNPRKFTLNVKPGERLSFLMTADAMGAWPFHCHLFYHMATGMMVNVIVADDIRKEHP